jgi:23S rRNA pseudoU1915 N3-methylase RlmH
MLLLTNSPTLASELVHQFKSPAFNGIGYSAHVMTLENLEHTRRQKIFDDKKSAAIKEAQDAKNTNLAKFLNNLESRIFATLSQKIAEQLFSDNGATSGSFDIASNNVQWSSDGSQITLRITDAGGSVTEVVVPYGSLAW